MLYTVMVRTVFPSFGTCSIHNLIKGSLLISSLSVRETDHIMLTETLRIFLFQCLPVTECLNLTSVVALPVRLIIE